MFLQRILLIIFLLKITNSFADTFDNRVNQINTTNQAIKLQEEDNINLYIELQKYKEESELPLRDEGINKDDVGKKRLRLEQLQIDINNINTRKNNIKKSLDEEYKRISNLQALLQKQSNPLAINNEEQKNSLIRTKEILANTEEYVNLLEVLQEKLNNTSDILQQKKNILESLYKRENERYLAMYQQSNLQEERLSSNRLNELERVKNGLLNAKIPVQESKESFLNRNIELLLVGKQILFENILINLTNIDEQIRELQFADFSNISLERITKIQNEIIDYSKRIAENSELLKEQFLINNEQFALYSRQLENIPYYIINRQENLHNTYKQNISLIDNILFSIKMIDKNIDKQYEILSKKYLKERFHFLQINFDKLFSLIANSLTTFAGQYAVAFETLYSSVENIKVDTTQLMIWMLLIIFIITLTIKHINRKLKNRGDSFRLPFAKRLVIIIYRMFKYNLPYLVLLLLTYSLVKFAQLTAPSSYLIMLIPSLFLAIAIPNFAAKTLISSNLISEQNNYLINYLSLIFSIGSALLALVFLAQWVLDMDNLSINIFRLFFGTYVLIISYPIFTIIKRTILYIDEYYNENYIYRIMRLLFILIPFETFLFGILSCFGYLNIAWLLSKYFSLFFLHSLLWIFILAILNDIALWAKRYSLNNTNNGLFWTQDVINPAHTIFRYLSLFLMIHSLLRIYQWDSKTPIIREILSFLRISIIGSNNNFTALNLLFIIFVVYFIFRIGSWVRSFSYRWIFGKIVDLGIRNSLSVFSQYAVVTIGFLLALRIIGLDLTTFTVFAGALGVGIGFGMQTIANNFISGILLLIERPLRNGDIITVGNYEGKVERIGMRSLTITTFNNESVILPNSDFVTSAFMNWSHSDAVLRTILYLDLSYKHDPQLVHQIFSDALNSLVKKGLILGGGDDFNFGIFAYNYSERGVTYRVQYYMNMDVHKLNDVRHEVVKALWQTCSTHNLEIAYPKRDLYFPSPEQFEKNVTYGDLEKSLAPSNGMNILKKNDEYL